MSNRTPVLLLAGGKSSRMGQPKGLVSFEGRPWIETQLARVARSGPDEVVVVLGFHASNYLERLPWLRDAQDFMGLRVRSITNPLPEFGPFSSIQAGAALLLEHPCEGAWVLPVDVPCPRPSVWQKLSASTASVCVPLLQNRGGHPVKLSADFLQRILKIPPDAPDSRLDHQIRLLGQDVERIEVDDPAVLGNLNTPGDWLSFS